MSESRYVRYDDKPPQDLDLSAAASFYVDCAGADALILHLNLTRVNFTALVFTFANAGVLDPTNFYSKAGVDYGTGAVTSAKPFTMTLAASGKHEVPFFLTGVGVTSGRVKVTITPTGGGAGDLCTVTPVIAKVM